MKITNFKKYERLPMVGIGKKKLGLIIAAIAVVCIGVAIYLKLSPKAEFEITSLEVSPSEAFVGEKVTISCVVKNTGNAEGNYECALVVNNTQVETKKIALSAGESKTVTFELSEDVEGNYTIQVGKRTAILVVYPKLFVGAYVKYNVEAFVVITTFEGTMRIDVTDVTKENFTIVMTAIGIPGFIPVTRTHRFGEPVVGPEFKENMICVGEEIISTAIGLRKAIHYYSYNATDQTETHQWIDKITNFPLLMVVNGEGLNVEVRLSDTNIKWLSLTSLTS